MASKFTVSGVNTQTPANSAAARILCARADALFDVATATTSALPADCVHDLRVASRRLREALTVMRDFYPRDAARAWLRRVRRVTRTLGPVRDDDVFIAAMAGLAQDPVLRGSCVVSYVTGMRVAQREAHRAAALKRLDLGGLVARRAAFREFAEHASDRREAIEFGSLARREIAARLSTVKELIPPALTAGAQSEQHRLRIAVKRLRYGVEVFAPAYGDRFEAAHSRLTALQDALGELHDAQLFIETIRQATGTEVARAAGVTEADVVSVTATLAERCRASHAAFLALVADGNAASLVELVRGPIA